MSMATKITSREKIMRFRVFEFECGKLKIVVEIGKGKVMHRELGSMFIAFREHAIVGVMFQEKLSRQKNSWVAKASISNMRGRRIQACILMFSIS